MIQLLLFVTNFSLAWTAADFLIKICHFFVALVAADDFFPHNWEGLLKIFCISTRDEIKHNRKIICSKCSTCYEYGDCFSIGVDGSGKQTLTTKKCVAMTLNRQVCGTPLLIERNIGKGKVMLVPVINSCNYTYLGLKNGLVSILSREDIREVRCYRNQTTVFFLFFFL